MKKIFLYGSLAIMAIGMASCNDFLDDNRYPLDEQTDNPEFWNNSTNIETMLNYFYNDFTAYGNGSGKGDFYFKTLSDDQSDETFANYTFTSVPDESSYWSSPFVEIRRANYIINNVRTSTLTESERQQYEGIARMMRAYEYFLLVKRYGDVQWINVVVDPGDEETVYAPRDDRDMVMDSVLADLNYACATVPSGTKITWSNDMAQAMKSDICLWEGTFCKYRTLDDNGKAADSSRAQKFLNECVTASQAVMNAGYTLNSDYQEVYNSSELTSNSEVILCKSYKTSVLMHSVIGYCNSTTPVYGITKDAFDSYLFKDGKPKGLTSYDDTDVAEISLETDADGKPILSEYSIQSLLDVRDARLSQTTDPAIYFRGWTYTRQYPDGNTSYNMTSMTGYGISKYDPTDPNYDNSKRLAPYNYTDAPIYWLPVVLLNYAEAKAELGTITQSDLDNSINLLYARADLPNLSVTPGFSDPSNDRGVSDLIWEIRRCRRCELITDNNFRYWDLVRWHMLDKLDASKYPDVLLGANVSKYQAYVDAYNAAAQAYNAKVSAEDAVNELSISISWNSEGYIDANSSEGGSNTRPFYSKYYYYPVPSTEITLSKDNLTQNPGW